MEKEKRKEIKEKLQKALDIQLESYSIEDMLIDTASCLPKFEVSEEDIEFALENFCIKVVEK